MAASSAALKDNPPISDLDGPTLLSQLPASNDNKPQKEAADWNRIFSHLESRLGMLRNWRYSWWAYWSVLAQFFNPRRYHWVIVANRMWKGSALNDAIIDSTGLQALRTCAHGMWSGLTNPSRPWLKLDKALPWLELDADAKDWLEDAEQRCSTVLAQSNFYTEMAQAFEDLTLFGTAPPIIYEDAEDVIHLYLPCAGEYYLACGARNEVDTLYREYTQTVIEIVEFCEMQNGDCPAEVMRHYDTGGASLDIEYVVCHAIEPNFPISGKGYTALKDQIHVVPAIFPWREVYWLKGQKTMQPLSKRGFMEQPFIPMRWAKVSNDAYGRSPCMDALGDNKQVQTETRRKGEFIEKGVRPPMGADPELKNEPYSIMPGQVTFFATGGAAGKKGFFPLFEPNAAWLQGLTADIELVNTRIKMCLFVDVFMAITQMQGVQPRNELELTKRDLERLQVLGPVIEIVENQLAIAIRRVLQIMERRKMLRPIPKSLQGVPLKISFVSIMRLAQRSAQAVAMKDMFATLGELSSASKAAGLPDPLRRLKLDDAAVEYGDATNFPTHLWFTPQEVLEHDQARQKAMTQQQTPANMMAAVTAAKTLSDTPLGGNSALSAITGGAGGGGAPAGV
jgi:Bacteriophage head to tail connecting protein